ncbi:PAS domain-containing protein [Pontixanthobacter sp.]|uniref:PAS domain-containing protein n=1 Tax=Pontixanthobacter sp. TaxID=2792078 RepID=UPI003C7A15C0
MATEQLQPWPAEAPPDPRMTCEAARSRVLGSYALDALENDPELASISAFAAQLCDAPTAMVSLVEEERQRFVARIGISDSETPRSDSFCAHAMLGSDILEIRDAAQDSRFAHFENVIGPQHIRFYAGAPLISHEGAPLGALCVIDQQPRPQGLSDMQRNGLEVLAQAVMRRLRHRREILAAQAEFDLGRKRLETLADSIPNMAWSASADGKFDYFNRRWFDFTGFTESVFESQDFDGAFHPEDRDQWVDGWETALADGSLYEAEFRMRRKDGEYRWMLARGLPVHGSSGQVEQWFGTLTDIHDARSRLEEKDLLTRELSHRIKNIFAVVGGLVALKSKDYPEAVPFTQDITKTLQALNRAHTYVTDEQSDSGDTLQGLLGKLMAPYADLPGTTLSITGDDAAVSGRSATPLALVFHELATNCAKYGSFSVTGGAVDISISVADGTVLLVWQEQGGPPPLEQRSAGFGSRLVEKSINGQLAGKLARDFVSTGLIATLTIPLASL